MSFWGCVVKPGQKHPIRIEESDVLHLSQACLHDPKQGKNYLQVEVDGTTYSIACLEKDKREHDCLDLFFDSHHTAFVCKGSSEIHLMGYIEPSDLGAEGSESEEEQVVTKAVSPKLSPKVVAASSPKTSPKVAPQVPEESDDDDFEDEESEEEMAPPAKLSPKAAAASSPKTAAKAAPQEDSSEMFEDEESEEEGMEGDDMSLLEEGEESEEESPEQQVAPPQKSPKQAVAQSPKRPATSEPQAPPAKKANTGASDDETAYVKKLVEYLKANGKTNAGQLGSKVPRPAGVPKLKALVENHKDKFTMVGDAVTAK